jgi:hypothetical protein
MAWRAAAASAGVHMPADSQSATALWNALGFMWPERTMATHDSIVGSDRGGPEDAEAAGAPADADGDGASAAGAGVLSAWATLPGGGTSSSSTDVADADAAATQSMAALSGWAGSTATGTTEPGAATHFA